MKRSEHLSMYYFREFWYNMHCTNHDHLPKPSEPPTAWAVAPVMRSSPCMISNLMSDFSFTFGNCRNGKKLILTLLGAHGNRVNQRNRRRSGG